MAKKKPFSIYDAKEGLESYSMLDGTNVGCNYFKDTLLIDIEYPNVGDNIKYVRLGITDVRAVSDIRIYFDFDRNGWVIEQPTRYLEGSSNDEGMIEVAFIGGKDVRV